MPKPRLKRFTISELRELLRDGIASNPFLSGAGPDARGEGQGPKDGAPPEPPRGPSA